MNRGNSNPFWDEEQDHPETTAAERPPSAGSAFQNPIYPTELSIQPDSQPTAFEDRSLSWEQIASLLIRKNFTLTALELHCELHERGILVPRLRDYFSNPANFESSHGNTEDEFVSGFVRRGSSSQTLDSLEYAREPSEIDPHDRSDERVAVLEFELRRARETIQNLREQLNSVTNHQSSDASSSKITSSPYNTVDDSSSTETAHPLEKRALDFLVNEYLLQNNYKLTSITFSDECQNLDFDDWDDVGLLEAKPPNLSTLFRRFRHAASDKRTRDVSPKRKDNPFSSDAAVQCDLTDENQTSVQNAEVALEEVTFLRGQIDGLSSKLQQTERKCYQLESELNASRSLTENNGDTNALLHTEESSRSPVSSPTTSRVIFHNVPKELERFYSTLASQLFHSDVQLDADNLRVLKKIEKISVDTQCLVQLLAETLVEIIPSVLLNKRQELIPLLLVTILLHEDHLWRDKLAATLFNLLKKPDEIYRRMILKGCERFAIFATAEQMEAELLPQCWTQITNKHIERRLLVAESCAVLAPFVSPALCGSLLLSMAKQVLYDDKADEVRERMVKSLAVICLHVEEPDKYPQFMDLLKHALKDSSDLVSRAAQSYLLPAVARWTALHLRALGPQFIEPLYFESIMSQEELVLMKSIAGIRKLVPHLLADVVLSGPWRQHQQDIIVPPAVLEKIRSTLPIQGEPFDRLDVLMGSDYVNEIGKFQSYIGREWFQEWSQLNWTKEEFIPTLAKCSSGIPVQRTELVICLSELFRCIVAHFGSTFAAAFISPSLKSTIQELGSQFLCNAVFPCFGCSIVAMCERQQLKDFLSSALLSISDQSLPLDGLVITFKTLGTDYLNDFVQVCWTGIVHHAVSVRLNAARLLRSLTEQIGSCSTDLESLVPLLVTLSSDTEARIRLEVVPSLCALLFMHIQQEKILTILVGFLTDRENLDITAAAIRELSRGANKMDKKFYQEFLLPHLAALVAQNSRLQVFRKDMAVCLLDCYTSLVCSERGEEPWLSGPVLQSLRSLVTELKDLGLAESAEIANELSERLARSNGSITYTSDSDSKDKSKHRVNSASLPSIFRKK